MAVQTEVVAGSTLVDAFEWVNKRTSTWIRVRADVMKRRHNIDWARGIYRSYKAWRKS